MIAVADAQPNANVADGDADDITPANLPSQMLAPRHNKGANVLFCDGHVEYAKQIVWMQKSARARQRWNNDNEPHPETWQYSP